MRIAVFDDPVLCSEHSTKVLVAPLFLTPIFYCFQGAVAIKASINKVHVLTLDARALPTSAHFLAPHDWP